MQVGKRSLEAQDSVDVEHHSKGDCEADVFYEALACIEGAHPCTAAYECTACTNVPAVWTRSNRWRKITCNTQMLLLQQHSCVWSANQQGYQRVGTQ
jgi:hypothetical protein